MRTLFSIIAILISSICFAQLPGFVKTTIYIQRLDTSKCLLVVIDTGFTYTTSVYNNAGVYVKDTVIIADPQVSAMWGYKVEFNNTPISVILPMSKYNNNIVQLQTTQYLDADKKPLPNNLIVLPQTVTPIK